jgi:hypothetical protein
VQQAAALWNCHLRMFELYGTQGLAVIAIIHLDLTADWPPASDSVRN